MIRLQAWLLRALGIEARIQAGFKALEEKLLARVREEFISLSNKIQQLPDDEQSGPRRKLNLKQALTEASWKRKQEKLTAGE